METTSRLPTAIVTHSFPESRCARDRVRGLPGRCAAPAADDAEIGAPALGARHGGGAGVRAGLLAEVGGQPPAEQPRVAAREDAAGELRAEAVEADLVHPQPGPALA